MTPAELELLIVRNLAAERCDSRKEGDIDEYLAEIKRRLDFAGLCTPERDAARAAERQQKQQAEDNLARELGGEPVYGQYKEYPTHHDFPTEDLANEYQRRLRQLDQPAKIND